MKICWTQWLMLVLVVTLGTSQILTACGNKGPLELPEELQTPAPSDEVEPKKTDKKPTE